jgi:flagellar FliL protein
MAKKPKSKTEEPAATGESKDAPQGKFAFLKNKKLMMMAGGGLAAFLIVAVGGAWALGMFKPAPRPEPQQTAQGPVGEAAQRPQRLPHFMDLPEITVNLTSAAQRPQFLRERIALELAEAQTATQIQPLMPRVLDAFQVYLREMRAADLEGSAAVHRLKEELMRRVNLAVQPARVDAVLFREILVQ